MTPLDIGRLVTDPYYTVENLSQAIIKINQPYDMLSTMGLFMEVGVPDLFIQLERTEYTVSLLSTTSRGGPGQTSDVDTRDKIAIGSTYIKFEDKLTAMDLQGLPAFGQPNFYEQFDMKLFEKSQKTLQKFNLTHEWHRWGALNGDVLDADGQTVILNTYQELGEQQRDIDYNFGATTSPVAMNANNEMRRYMEQELKGERLEGILAICSPEFFDKLIQHPFYEEYYKKQQGMIPNPIMDDVANGFRIGNVLYMEHNGLASYVNPQTKVRMEHKFITPGEAIALPLGTIDTFYSYFAPGTMVDSVNQPGEPLYVSMKELDHREGIELRYESAPLHIVKHPRLVMRLHSST